MEPPASAPPRPLHPDDLGIGRVFDALRDAMVVADAGGRVVLWNPAATRVFGFSEAEALGLALGALFAEPGQGVTPAGPGKPPSVPSGDAVLELAARRQDGREVLVEATFSPLRNNGDAYILAIFRDVTERRRAVAETKATFSLLSATLEGTADGVLVVGTDGRIACFNQRLVQLWGVPGSLVASMEPTRTFAFILEHLQSPEAFLKRARDLRDRAEAESIDTLELKDGRVIEARSAPQRMDGALAGRVWCFRDVTQRRRAEEALRQTEAQYRTLVEGVHAVVWRGDARTFQLQFVSKEAEGILGYPAEQWLRQPRFWEDHLHPEDHDWAVANARKGVAEGRSHVSEYRMLAADGRTVWVRDVVRVGVVDGEPRELFGVMLDVTERKLAEEAQRGALERLLELDRLKESDQAKTELLRTAGHELNTPLATIHSLVGLLRSDGLGPLNEEQARALGMLDRNVQRLIHLVRDVLEAARLQGGRLQLRPREVDLGALVEEVAESFREQARQAEVRLQVVVEPSLQVRADPQRLTQVLFNLLSNALKYTPAGGTVAATAGSEEGEAVLRVQDSGPGLTLDEIARLFQPFAQVQRAGPAPPGNGLGLYISKGIVEEHGGRIWAESAGPGLGATFGVALPRLRAVPSGPRKQETGHRADAAPSPRRPAERAGGRKP